MAPKSTVDPNGLGQTGAMLAFDDLTRTGKLRRLRLLAIDALRANFDFGDVTVRLVAHHSFNTTFRVDTGGDRFALRVGGDVPIHGTGIEYPEADWLDELASSNITAPRNVATSDGMPVVFASHTGVRDRRPCSLFTWVDGVQLRTRQTTEGAYRSGELLAALHEHACSRPAAFISEALLARSVIRFGENLIAAYTSSHGSLFRDAEAKVQAEVDRIWASTDQVHSLHGDFGPHNILSWRKSLRPIDFQDMRYGHSIQDVGITLADMTRSRPDLIKPFLDGYASIRELPDLSPEVRGLHALARSLDIMNLGLLAPRSGIAQAFADHERRVVDWMAAN